MYRKERKGKRGGGRWFRRGERWVRGERDCIGEKDRLKGSSDCIYSIYVYIKRLIGTC